MKEKYKMAEEDVLVTCDTNWAVANSLLKSDESPPISFNCPM